MLKKLIIILILSLLAVSTQVFAQDLSDAKVIAYYFHGDFRCVTCNNMENYSKEAIQANFQEDLDSGKIEFKTINVEKSPNEHFAKDYNLYTKSLILSLVKDGKEIKSKNLDKIWEYSRDKQKFITYVSSELGSFIKDAQ